MTIDPECERCGLCCDGYTFWMTNRSFDDDPLGIKDLIEFHGCIAQKNKKGELGIRIPIPCKHGQRIEGKHVCKVYEHRPLVCKEYFCEKVIKKALEKQLDGVHV